MEIKIKVNNSGQLLDKFQRLSDMNDTIDQMIMVLTGLKEQIYDISEISVETSIETDLQRDFN
jgi:hypothetical protein